VGCEGLIGAEDDGSGDIILQLADIAGPVITFEELKAVGVEAFQGDFYFAADLSQEEVGEFGDVLGALAEGRDEEGNDVEAVVEVFAESAGGDTVGEGAVGGGDDLGAGADGAVSSDAGEFFFLDDPEEFDLGIGGEFGDLIEEEDAFAGKFEFAFAAFLGTGEGAFFVAEEFGFEEFGGDSGTVDGDEGAFAAVGGQVQLSGDEFFPDAGFAGDENGIEVHGREADAFAELLHGGAAADHAGIGAVDFVGDEAAFFFAVDRVGGFLEEETEFGQRGGFGDIVEGTAFHGFDGGVHGSVVGDHDDGEQGIDAADEGKQVQAAAVFIEHEVEENEVRFEVPDSLLAGGGLVDDAAVIILGHECGQIGGKVAVVVDDEETCFHRIPSFSSRRKQAPS